MPKLKFPTKSHPGRAGRKPAPLPSFLKRFRATDEEHQEFISLLSGDARTDFLWTLEALRDFKKKPHEDFAEW